MLHENQAVLGVHSGGLGLRRATDVALPAFIAARIEARPLVAQLDRGLGECGLDTPRLLERVDADVAAAQRRLRIRFLLKAAL